MKLPENFKILQNTWYCKTAILRLKIKISAKLHQKSSKTASLQTLTPPHIYMYIGQLMSMQLSLNSWQLYFTFFSYLCHHPSPLPPHPLPGFFPSRDQTVGDWLTQGVFVWTVWMQSSATSVCIILLPFAVFSCQGVWMPWSLQLESWFPFFSFVKFLDCSLYLLWFARSQKMCNKEVKKCNIQHSEYKKEFCF